MSSDKDTMSPLHTMASVAARLEDDIEAVRDALHEALIWCPSEITNDAPCRVRDAQEAFERVAFRARALPPTEPQGDWPCK